MSKVSVASMLVGSRERGVERIGQYSIYDEIGSGGMASVHLGKLRSASGFTRLVAIKRMHAELAKSPEFVAMFFQEARLIGRIQHPNVVAALDCVAVDSSAILVMEYVHGVSLNQLMRKPIAAPPAVSSAILVGAAIGLHAAHEAVDEHGVNLGIVHRDVSPHNILVGVDGLARVLDFGIAKAAERVHHTRTGEVKGKIGYMAPEQLFGESVSREADVYSLGVVMWELVTGRRLYANAGHGQMIMRIAATQIDSPRSVNPRISAEVEKVVMKALARAPQNRYRTALEFAVAVERCMPPASQRVVGEWIAGAARSELARRSELRAQIDLSIPGRSPPPAEDSAVTSPFRASRPSVSQIGRIRRGLPQRAVLVGSTLVAIASVAILATCFLSSHKPVELDSGRAGSSADRPALRAPEVRATPVRGVAEAGSAGVTAIAPASRELPVSPQAETPPEESAAPRTPARAPLRPRPSKPKGTPLGSAVSAAPSVTAPVQSDLGAIGGRE